MLQGYTRVRRVGSVRRGLAGAGCVVLAGAGAGIGRARVITNLRSLLRCQHRQHATLGETWTGHWPLETKIFIVSWGFVLVLYCWQCGCFDCSDDQSFYLQNEPSEAARQSLRVPDLSCPSVAEWSDPGTRRPGLCTPLIDLYPACTSPVGGFEPRHWFVDFNLARVQRLQILLCTYQSGNIYEPGLDRFYQFNLKDWTFPSDRCNPILIMIIVDYLHESRWFLRYEDTDTKIKIVTSIYWAHLDTRCQCPQHTTYFM